MEFRVTDLDGKVVVITGGARGMGAAYVRGFLAEGAKVVAADLSWDGVEGGAGDPELLPGGRGEGPKRGGEPHSTRPHPYYWLR